MLKVLKFGGSSLADAQQFAKVKAIVEADESRRVVIVSAPGKRFSGDHKITDLLYLCAAHIKYGVSCEEIFDMIRTRYLEIAHDCGLKLDLNPDFDALWAKMQEGIEKDELASRGEYFSCLLYTSGRHRAARDRADALPPRQPRLRCDRHGGGLPAALSRRRGTLS